MGGTPPSSHSPFSLLVGDTIVTSNGQPFKGYWKESGLKKLLVKRDGKELKINIKVEYIDLSRAMFEAQKNSVEIFSLKGKRIGYIRLWTGTHPESSVHLKKIAKNFKNTTDAMILDLRDGCTEGPGGII